MHSRHASDPVAAQARGHVLMPWICTGSAESAVEVLLQRISDGVLAEDRQEALADLRDLISNNTQVLEPPCLPCLFLCIFRLPIISTQRRRK